MRLALAAACALSLFGAESLASGSIYALDCGRPLIKPSEIVFTCADHGAYMEHIRWRRWGGSIAVGSGVYSECETSCVVGPLRSHRATIWLGDIGRCHDSARRYYRRFKVSGAHFAYPYLCIH